MPVTDEIRKQILAIRACGVTNMFDVPRVLHEAYVRGFHELIEYLNSNRVEYSRFILTGEYTEQQ